ncbi:hypothetical protein GUJ93_ZPchr0013g35343 [Zizania palustris]|uniref:Uncharacterized protein n=1 Tax=Zizania palustris TaxID=103762 RepID=A0A8J6C054_ZIZPA|nr:hypothetical protein GUJ93_ZPchr0013g35343 [Zizania palustris]
MGHCILLVRGQTTEQATKLRQQRKHGVEAGSNQSCRSQRARGTAFRHGDATVRVVSPTVVAPGSRVGINPSSNPVDADAGAGRAAAKRAQDKADDDTTGESSEDSQRSREVKGSDLFCFEKKNLCLKECHQQSAALSFFL